MSGLEKQEVWVGGSTNLADNQRITNISQIYPGKNILKIWRCSLSNDESNVLWLFPQESLLAFGIAPYSDLWQTKSCIRVQCSLSFFWPHFVFILDKMCVSISDGEAHMCLYLSNWNSTTLSYGGARFQLYSTRCHYYRRRFLCETIEGMNFTICILAFCNNHWNLFKL